MASSGNFPLWSPIVRYANNLTNGNARFTGAGNAKSARTAFAIPTGTKFYVECLIKIANYYNWTFGVANSDFNLNAYDESDATMNGILFRANSASTWDICSITNGSRGSFSSDVGQTATRVLGMTINRVDNEIKMYLDNVLKFTISISATETYHIVTSHAGGAQSNNHSNINCGHDSTGNGDFSAASNTDENGFGEFQYSPPTGFLALCSANLPISSDIDPGGDDGETENPTKHFGIVTYTGDGSARTISGLGFQPDLIWAKRRSETSVRHYWVDSSRGFTKYLHSDGSFTQGTSTSSGESGGVTSANSDGFVIGGALDYVNANTDTYVAWCWKAGGGTTSTNTQGTATSTVQANTKAGFSICLTDNYTATNGVTIGHGLGKAPAFYLHKTTGDNSSGGASQNFTWHVYHQSLGATKAMFLDTNATVATAIGYWNNTEPTSTVLSLGNLIAGNGQSIVYAWSEIEGYSKFGQYDGNANADGSVVYTGFRPRLLILRAINVASDGWLMYDTARETVNPLNSVLKPHDEAAEYTATAFNLDILSNGFKLRSSDNAVNGTSYDPYIYMAWADVPFKYNNTLP